MVVLRWSAQIVAAIDVVFIVSGSSLLTIRSAYFAEDLNPFARIIRTLRGGNRIFEVSISRILFVADPPVIAFENSRRIREAVADGYGDDCSVRAEFTCEGTRLPPVKSKRRQ